MKKRTIAIAVLAARLKKTKSDCCMGICDDKHCDICNPYASDDDEADICDDPDCDICG